MSRIQLAIASAVTALLIAAGGAVAVRTSGTAGTLASIGGGRVVQGASTPAPAPAPAPAAAPAPVVALPGPRGLPFSSPVSMDAALAATGYKFPPGSAVYAAKITKEPGGLAYEDYEGASGALGTDFWPASSIKVLAAVGALEYVG
jgi:hypothetical protein